MSEHGEVAGRSRQGAAKRQASKPLGGGKRPSTKMTRQQFHLEELVSHRLGVHATLMNKDKSKIVNEILGSWLTRYGQGRELFPSLAPSDSSDGVESLT